MDIYIYIERRINFDSLSIFKVGSKENAISVNSGNNGIYDDL